MTIDIVNDDCCRGALDEEQDRAGRLAMTSAPIDVNHAAESQASLHFLRVADQQPNSGGLPIHSQPHLPSVP